ncbi:MAG: TPM domain-containing protein [Candidatus Peribacteria bacterium]|nr:TPM domain-containing protein [Candidatus Peribacteria bacterium]
MNKLPPLEWYITDFTDTLTLDQLNELEAIAENYAEKTTNQLIAVVIPDRQGRELFDIGIKLFNENGIGTTANNGLLLLISKEENQMQSGPVRSNGKIRIIV